MSEEKMTFERSFSTVDKTSRFCSDRVERLSIELRNAAADVVKKKLINSGFASYSMFTEVSYSKDSEECRVEVRLIDHGCPSV